MKIQQWITVCIVALAVIGCNRKQTNEEHPHDESLQLSAYNEYFEVFADANPFVTGNTCMVLVHITKLEDFKPLTEGKVTLSLIIGDKGIRQQLENPTTPGIYKFSVKPEIQGEGYLRFDIETTQGTSQIIIPNIIVYTDEHQAHEAAAATAVTSSNGVVFPKEQSWKVDFSTEEVKREPFGMVIKSTAQILPSQTDERMITAKANGIVLISGGNVVEGTPVKSGQALFSIESSGMADNNLAIRYKEAHNEYIRAKTEYERKKELAKDQIVSESDLLRAKTEFVNAETNYENLHKNFSSGKYVVSSPVNGFITKFLVRNGEYTEAGQPVMIVSQNRDLLIKAEIQPRYLSMLNNITSANFKVLNSNNAYSLEELGGKIVSYGKSVGLDNPLIPVIFQVQNKVGLFPGSFVEVYIKTQSEKNALTIPNGAIVEEMGSYFVFVQLTPVFYEKRPIVKGETDGYRTEILEGVQEKERVVSKGAILVKLAQASGALDAHSGHVH